jgi:amidase
MKISWLLTMVFSVIWIFVSAQETPLGSSKWETQIERQQEHPNPRMRFKIFRSIYSDTSDMWRPFEKDLSLFLSSDYERLKPFILEQSIEDLQTSVMEEKLNYEQLVLFYLYRIREIERDDTRFLQAIISLNPKVIEEARAMDIERKKDPSKPLLFGMPILLKDNINTIGMPTTAGAVAMKTNQTADDAFVVKRLKSNGALILGKANLSEWAYYFCSGCPVGYSAIGGQTMNPYGHKIHESGGSSSGSGVAVAANLAVAAVGTETSGSILSPASMNSIVGMKPTIGVMSRSGIVPISASLDTPGPMTKNVRDNIILYNAMYGQDNEDEESIDSEFIDLMKTEGYSIRNKKIAIIRQLLDDPDFLVIVDMLDELGAEIIAFDPPNVSLDGFYTLLNGEMKIALPQYLNKYAGPYVRIRSVEDVVHFNKEAADKRAPYGQQLFEGIVSDSTSPEKFLEVRQALFDAGKEYFSEAWIQGVDAVLSMNNQHAGYAALGKFPCITVPMGYKDDGRPIGLTFIGNSFQEEKIYLMAHAFEQATKFRKAPEKYVD